VHVWSKRPGFHGVWASGFEISASYGVPDASILTMTETLDAARKMADAVRIPVIADCDTGFGNAINAIRTVEAFEACGRCRSVHRRQHLPEALQLLSRRQATAGRRGRAKR
jgi:2-methylisocitrate lyase-like PEP mutase family enzyme